MVALQGGRVEGGGGRTLAEAGPRRRWVPPSSLRHREVLDGDAKHNVILRKVRGILNKLTPEKFTKLGDDLLALDLDSDKVLKGMILLVFDKALDEPKYSSMYAQLCKRLSEEAPNREPPGQPCTFNLLLLNKCRAEFENRAQAFAAFDGRALEPDEEERRHLSKCKMLGNIKFIGELGKLEILSEAILHRCIQTLLARRGVGGEQEDLECLAQLVRTCGRVLDSERGRGLMDQYFARIETLAAARELAPRLRFMLRDVLELRRGGWVPRAAAAPDGPVPIAQLRPEPRAEREQLFRRSRPLDAVLAGLTMAPAPPDKLFSNGFGRDGFRQRSAPAAQQFHRAAAQPAKRKARPPPAAPLDELQMRPATNSLIFTANRLSRAPPPQPPPPPAVLSPAFSAPAPLLKEPAISIKPAPDKKDKPKKDKGASKEEAVRVTVEAVRELARRCGTEPLLPAAEAPAAAAPGPRDSSDDEPEAAEAPAPDAARERELAAAAAACAAPVLALQLPDKLLRRAAAAALDHALSDHELASCWASCALARAVRRGGAPDALRALLPGARAHPAAPRLLAHAVHQRLLPLGEAAALADAPALLLDTLAALMRLMGARALLPLYAESKLDVVSLLAAAGEPAQAAAAALAARGLLPLAPALRLAGRLARAVQREPAPAALFRWIKTHVAPSLRAHPAFASALVALLCERVSAAAAAAGAAGAGAGAEEAAAEAERERAQLEQYAPLLRALLHRAPPLQLAAVYAVQMHAHRLRYPKGMLLRWFMHLYHLEVCEEEAFLRWREDVACAAPGKGEALFQVNTWLTWLQQQESEDEDAED